MTKQVRESADAKLTGVEQQTSRPSHKNDHESAPRAAEGSPEPSPPAEAVSSRLQSYATATTTRLDPFGRHAGSISEKVRCHFSEHKASAYFEGAQTTRKQENTDASSVVVEDNVRNTQPRRSPGPHFSYRSAHRSAHISERIHATRNRDASSGTCSAPAASPSRSAQGAIAHSEKWSSKYGDGYGTSQARVPSDSDRSPCAGERARRSSCTSGSRSPPSRP